MAGGCGSVVSGPNGAGGVPGVTVATDDSPALLRHRLRSVLKQARAAAGLTQREVADKLEWSASKIIRIEQGDVGVSKTDLKALVEQYELDDRFAELASWASRSRKQPWSEYDVLKPESRRYFGYEAAAKIIRSFEPQLVHGLLQTDDYTKAILTTVYGLKKHDVEQHIDVRRVRRLLLEDTPDSSEAFFLLSEAVVRSPVGGVDVMHRQLEHLIELSHRPKIRIQVLPLSTGAHLGMRGPFVYLEFAEEDDRDVLYLETAMGDRVILDDPEVITPYREGFKDLEKIATPPEDASAHLKRYIDELR
jgi:transcriptional regulator with XRE-family HTH domain